VVKQILWGICLVISTGHALAKQPVSVSVKFGPETVRRGGQGEILIRFAPKAGFHVNQTPPVSVTFKDVPWLAVEMKKSNEPADDTQKTVAGDQVLDTSTPVRFSIKVTKKAPLGKQNIKVAVTYYYCSDKDGWCAMATEELPLEVTVVKR